MANPTPVKKRMPAKLPEKPLVGSRARHINTLKRQPTWAKAPYEQVRNCFSEIPK